MQGRTPAVFVSSTFFDLRQIRADLARFIEDQLGYRALLSEFHSFPIDPGAGAVENCIRRVEQEADILLLIIGGRFGGVEPTTGKSITNLEYLAARRKGIPVYAFVEKRVLNVLPIWETNRGGDFSQAVEDPRAFDFIAQIRNVEKIWTHDFETADDIITAIRAQLAYLVSDALSWRMRVARTPALALVGITGQALRLAVEQPSAWEYKVFAQVLSDELAKHGEMRRSHRLGFVHGVGEHVSADQTGEWLQGKLSDLNRTVQSLDRLFKGPLQQAFGPPGQPGSVIDIVFVARTLGRLYADAIEWAQSVRRANLGQRYHRVAEEMARFADQMIAAVEDFGPEMLSQLTAAMATGGGSIELTLSIELSNAEAFRRELDRLHQEEDEGSGL